MAPTKELTQPMAAVTREVTEEIISDKVNPPLQTDKPLNQSDTKADKPDNHEHKNQRIVSNGTDKGTDPRDTSGDDFTNVTNNGSESTSSRSRSR